jgi:thiol-disulfide isomerase/thioredoxin
MRIIELNQVDFQGTTVPKARDSGGLLIVKADWCGHCKRTLPELEKVADMTGSVFPIYKLDADKYPSVVKRLGVEGFPTIFWIDRKGQVGDTYEGERSTAAFLKAVCNKTRHCY